MAENIEPFHLDLKTELIIRGFNSLPFKNIISFILFFNVWLHWVFIASFGLSLGSVHRLLTVGIFPVAEHRL